MIGNVHFLLSSSLCFPLFLLTVSTIIPLPPNLEFCHEGLQKKSVTTQTKLTLDRRAENITVQSCRPIIYVLICSWQRWKGELINSMEHCCSWKVQSPSTDSIPWNEKYRVHNLQPMDPILNQMAPDHILRHKIPILILSSHLRQVVCYLHISLFLIKYIGISHRPHACYRPYSIRYTLDRRQGVPHSWSGHNG
jgi:hypothetical protein